MAGPPEMCAWGMGKVPAQVAFLSPPPVGAPAGASAGAVEPGGGLAHSPPLQKLPPWRERRAPGGEREDRTPAHLCRAACCRSGTVPTSHLLEHPHLDPPWVSLPLARTPSSSDCVLTWCLGTVHGLGCPLSFMSCAASLPVL